MQGVKILNDLFSPSNVKCVAVNHFAPNGHQKNFINSLHNARNTLGCLEHSICKSNKYQRKLLHCKGTHTHSHDVNVWWNSDHSEEKSFKCSNTTSTCNSKSPRSQDDITVTESWSTMSIVCLQYQYEELAKRYKALLQAYNEQCYAVGLRDKRLSQWQQRASISHAHLAHAHSALLTVGEKYMTLKNKRITQKSWYEKQLIQMRKTLREVMEVAKRARMRFDARLAYCMANERDSDAALLLYEIRKCNILVLENMRLKALIEELIPGQVIWNNR